MRYKILLLIILSGCSMFERTPPNKAPITLTFDQKRFNCINSLMGSYKEFSTLKQITHTCEKVIICNTCNDGGTLE